MASRLPAFTAPSTASPSALGVPSCPSWCDPTRCDGGAGHDDIRHVSAPQTWRAEHDDAQLSLARYRLDSRGEPGPEGWLLTICHDGVEEEASVMCTDHDLDQVAVARMTLRLAATDVTATDADDVAPTTGG